MAGYPASVYSPRAKENKSGVSYDPDKKTVLFVEDITALDDEVVAIETELGANPKGSDAAVVDRLNRFDNGLSNFVDQILKSDKRLWLFSGETYDSWGGDVGGSGTIVQSFMIAVVNTGASAGSHANQFVESQETYMSTYAGKVCFRMYLGGMTGNTVGFIGIVKGIQLGAAHNSSNLVTKHAGLFYEAGQWHCSCANGATQTKEAVTISGVGWFCMDFSESGKIKFYWQGVLIKTLTTNLPNDYGFLQYFVHNKAVAGVVALYLYNAIYYGA